MRKSPKPPFRVRLNSVVADVDSRTEFAVKNPQIRAQEWDSSGPGIGEAFGEGLVEVAAHLGFQFYLLKSLETRKSTDPGEFIVGLRQAEIIGKDADLDVLTVLRGGEGTKQTATNDNRATLS